ncbi:MAG TPA: hypothetical protein ENK57_09670 [Polyangiaceae bacterium]|nr:hypothetical protein [Polyangiaceae bacterium]
MPRLPALVVTLTFFAWWGSLGCKGDDPSPPAATASPIEVQPTDSLVCGFGVTPEKGPWDEITLQADGSIKWTHVGPDATRRPEENFAKTATLDASATEAWMREVAAIGVAKRTHAELAADAERTTCRGALGGEKVDFSSAGLPDPPLRAHLDALTARCITGE